MPYPSCGSGEGFRGGSEPLVHEVAADQLVERDLPVAVLARSRKSLDDAVNASAVLGHLALDVEDERILQLSV
jgi:hypothetical protein